MREFSDKSQILSQIKTHYNFKNDAEFARYLDIKPNTLSNWHSRNTIDYELIVTKCVDIDANWLLTGQGEMLKNEGQEVSVRKLRTDMLMDTQNIPLYDVQASAGVIELLGKNRLKQVPIDYIRIPKLPKCDGALYITGDSMYPLLKSGDIVMYKEIKDIAHNIIWGEMYLTYIEHNGDEFFFTKYLQRSEKEGFVKFVSQNQHHQSIEFPLHAIKALAMVKASIRINSQL
jgi:phage repressor protein C with HTH and peptisase S24 domain